MSGLTYFGSEAAKELENWQNRRRRITFAKAVPGGGSGALLAFVFHRGDAEHPQQKLLLKLCAEDEGAVNEPRDLEEAWHSHPDFDPNARPFDFPERRLIRQVYPPLRVGGTWLMFLKVALDERARHPLSPLTVVGSLGRQAQVAASVIDSVLTEWNPDPDADHDMTAQTFLHQALGHRAAPDSRLAQVSARLLGAQLHNSRVRLPGWPGALSNPTPFADPPPLAGLKPPTVALGRAHYDLHPGNIMVATQPDVLPNSFRLVDLSRFQEQGLLLRDPVHLMLCLVGDHLPDLNEQARDELAGLLLDQDPDSADPSESRLPAGLLNALQLLRAAPDLWRMARDYAHADWHPQYLLALQACALMFLTRRTEEDEQLWFLRLAASACEAFQDLAEPVTGHDPAPTPPDQGTVRPSVSDEGARGLPPALHAELTRHHQQLEHLRTRCADARFDAMLAENLYIVINRCTRIADLARDGIGAEAVLALHDQCTRVLETARALQAVHDRPGRTTEKETARVSFVTALARLLDSPGDRSRSSEGDLRPGGHGPTVEPGSTLPVAAPPEPGVAGGLDPTAASFLPALAPLPEIPTASGGGNMVAEHIRIGLWGGECSGKTTYLTALPVAAMQSGRQGEESWTINGMTSEANAYLVQGTAMLAVERAFPPATSAVRALSWLLRGTVPPRLMRPKRLREVEVTLDIKDIPGIAFDETHPLHDEVIDELARAQGLIYLFDPLAGAQEAAHSVSTFLSTLNGLAKRVRDSGGILRGRLPHQVSVCVAKFDAPEVFRPAVEAGWVTQDSHGPRLPRVPGHIARQYFEWLCDNAPHAHLVRDGLTTHFHPERVAYYATSAIGFRMNQHHHFDYRDFANLVETGGPPRIRSAPEPINVLEPLTDLAHRIRMSKGGKR
ncbi:hypothetical protein AB0F46_23825 [Streptomyces sp. NPDC026665]|uniref:hypothetical protein n=1 Tax=Streptomyces sp. NPDC026665 TaxID=3154798 RepID=UPI0033D0D5CB